MPLAQPNFAPEHNLIDELFAKLDPNTDVKLLTSAFTCSAKSKPKARVLDEEGMRLRRLMQERS